MKKLVCVFAAVLVATMCVCLPANAAAGKAGLVIVHGSGKVKVDCVKLPEEEVNGVQLLRASRFGFRVAHFEFGPAICWIDGQGVNTRDPDKCFKDNGKFWDYWNQDSGTDTPVESSVGAADVTHAGDVRYWTWGAYPQPEPPHKTFEDICGG